ncbi:hypothetical protein ACS0TY_033289 [Phlomoides rotata]
MVKSIWEDSHRLLSIEVVFSRFRLDQKLKDAQSSTNQVGAKILLKGTTNPENSRRKSCWESYRM